MRLGGVGVVAVELRVLCAGAVAAFAGDAEHGAIAGVPVDGVGDLGDVGGVALEASFGDGARGLGGEPALVVRARCRFGVKRPGTCNVPLRGKARGGR